jgi:hypothetical protein
MVDVTWSTGDYPISKNVTKANTIVIGAGIARKDDIPSMHTTGFSNSSRQPGNIKLF